MGKSAWLSTWLLGADVTYGGERFGGEVLLSVATRLDFSATWHLEISYRLDSTRTLNFWREDEASNIWREIAGSYSYPATATSEPLRAVRRRPQPQRTAACFMLDHDPDISATIGKY